jgi:hypothetical protein
MELQSINLFRRGAQMGIVWTVLAVIGLIVVLQMIF